MIRVNLVPKEELESQLWFAPELMVLILVAFAGNTWVDSEISLVQDQIAEVSASRDAFNEKAKKIKPQVDRFKNLGKDKDALMLKLRALKAITGSRLSKYRELIVIEHLQNLKPESVWLTNLSIDGTSMSFDAYASDNILVAEFITALKSTQYQDVDPSDLRTQVFFTDAILSGTSEMGVNLLEGQSSNNGATRPQDAGGGTIRFKLVLPIGERSVPEAQDKNNQASHEMRIIRGGLAWTLPS